MPCLNSIRPFFVPLSFRELLISKSVRVVNRTLALTGHVVWLVVMVVVVSKFLGPDSNWSGIKLSILSISLDIPCAPAL